MKLNLPDNWSWKKVHEVADVVSGATPRRDVSDYWNGDVPWITPKEIGGLEDQIVTSTEECITEEGYKSASCQMLPIGTVLLSSRAPIGHLAITGIPICTNQGFKSLVPKKGTDSKYLYCAIRARKQHLIDLGRGATFKEVSKAIVEEFELPFPETEDEQKRIAAVLDKADALRRKRREALRLTDEFLRSTFLDMFGDLRTNSKGWPMRPLAEGVAEFEGGRNFNPTDTPRSDGFKVLKVSAVTSGEYIANESKHFSESDEVPAHYLVRPSDLLISRANTAELVGAVAYVWETQGTEVLPDKLWRFVWPEQPTVEPLFMLHLARSPYFRDQLIQRATGSSGSMKNIGKAKMLEIPIPYPPYSLQQRFSDIAKQVQKNALRSARATQDAETLFSALQQRAFSGEL